MREDLDNYIFAFCTSLLYILGAIKLESVYSTSLGVVLILIAILIKENSTEIMSKIGLEVTDKISEPIVKLTAISFNFFIIFLLLSKWLGINILVDVTYRIALYIPVYFTLIIIIKFLYNVEDVPILEGVSEEEFKARFPKVVKGLTIFMVLMGVLKFILKMF